MDLPGLSCPASDAVANAPALSAASFSDIDEQADALRGWNQRYLQLSAGRFRGAVRRLQLPGIGLFVEDLEQAVHQTGHVGPQVVALGVPLLLEGASRFCGQAGDASALHVFSGDSGFEFRSPQRHVMLGLEIDAALFESHVSDATAVDAVDFTRRARLLGVDGAALGVLRRFLVDLFACAAGDPTLLNRAAHRHQVRDELLDRLVDVLRPVSTGRPAAPRSAASAAQVALAERARRLVDSRLDEPPTVAELCILLGVSRRTLQNCFQATWGTGPLAWLKLLRLDAVRRRLKDAESVTEAATRLGFWHFGHFASDYRTLFGEPPSQTLRRHRGPAATASH